MLKKAMMLWSIIKSMTPGVTDKMSDVTTVLAGTTARLEAMKEKKAKMRKKIDAAQRKLQGEYDQAVRTEMDAETIICKIREALK